MTPTLTTICFTESCFFSHEILISSSPNTTSFLSIQPFSSVSSYFTLSTLLALFYKIIFLTLTTLFILFLIILRNKRFLAFSKIYYVFSLPIHYFLHSEVSFFLDFIIKFFWIFLFSTFSPIPEQMFAHFLLGLTNL